MDRIDLILQEYDITPRQEDRPPPQTTLGCFAALGFCAFVALTWFAFLVLVAHLVR